ncbi:hypothetical protein FS749_013849 [Ceratobasidium sp. UAMH 11750]|nr:hypothetical protein FS749_013849 [Ceratobasidium sp. UAMH 11750]
MFYDGLKDEIKSAMVVQLFDYDTATTTFAHVANCALEINQCLEAPKPRMSASSIPKPSTSSTSNPTTVHFAVNNYVYMTNTDRQVVKGQIKLIKKDVQGHAKPMVLWNGQKEPISAPFLALKKDNSPARSSPTFMPITPPSSSRSTTTTTTKTTSGPVPMDLDSANQSCPPFTCHNYGGKGHMARECPSKGLLGHEAKIEEIISEEEESGKEDA